MGSQVAYMIPNCERSSKKKEETVIPTYLISYH